MIRLVYVLRRLPNLSRQEFQTYWRNTHGPLVAKHSTAMRVRRYVQTHTLDDPINDLLQAPRGTAEPYDGVAELWWNHENEVAEGVGSPEGLKAAEELLEDVKKFIDFSRSSIYWGTEVPQINPTPENLVAREETPTIKLCFFGHHQARTVPGRGASTGECITAHSSGPWPRPPVSSGTCRFTAFKRLWMIWCGPRAARCRSRSWGMPNSGTIGWNWPARLRRRKGHEPWN